MTPEELQDYNNVIAILNEVIEGWEKLDEYRAEKDADKKMKKLFVVHAYENKAKRMVKEEIARLELKNQNKNAA